MVASPQSQTSSERLAARSRCSCDSKRVQICQFVWFSGLFSLKRGGGAGKAWDWCFWWQGQRTFTQWNPMGPSLALLWRVTYTIQGKAIIPRAPSAAPSPRAGSPSTAEQKATWGNMRSGQAEGPEQEFPTWMQDDPRSLLQRAANIHGEKSWSDAFVLRNPDLPDFFILNPK